jgi:hypothetical protein
MANSRGMERAVLSMGDEKGQFKGILDRNSNPFVLERDNDKPIRLTVQFYLCTDADTMTDQNINDVCDQIRYIYDKGLNEGSLVVDYTIPKPGLSIDKIEKRPTATTNKPYIDNNIL